MKNLEDKRKNQEERRIKGEDNRINGEDSRKNREDSSRILEDSSRNLASTNRNTDSCGKGKTQPRIRTPPTAKPETKKADKACVYQEWDPPRNRTGGTHLIYTPIPTKTLAIPRKIRSSPEE